METPNIDNNNSLDPKERPEGNQKEQRSSERLKSSQLENHATEENFSQVSDDTQSERRDEDHSDREMNSYWKLNDQLARIGEWINLHKLVSLVIILLTVLIPATPVYLEIISSLQPLPPMQGELNIAVAEIAVYQADGKPQNSKDGIEVANFIHQRLTENLSQNNIQNVNYELRSPEDTGKVNGEKPSVRKDAAEILAKEINADIVVYGVIMKDKSEFTPEFYVDYEGFNIAEEITGQHQLGSPLSIELPFEETELQDIDNPALSARTNALCLMTIGIAYYSADNTEKALELFHAAENVSGWLRNSGKEVLYLMIGNTLAKKASTTKSQEDLNLALTAYQEALEIAPLYSRAQLGKAGILYLLALGDPTDESFDTVNVDQLNEAELAFASILQQNIGMEDENNTIKASFGLGQIYFVYAQLDGGDWYDRASAMFQRVIEAHEKDKEQMVELGSQSFARIALIERIKGNPEVAIKYYRQSIDGATPYYKAYYHTRIGEILVEENQISNAIGEYEEAVKIAEYNGDEKSVDQYLARIQELKR